MKRKIAETRLLSAMAAFTVARGQDRSREVYCGRSTSIPIARPLRRMIRRIVDVGKEVEKRARRDW